MAKKELILCANKPITTDISSEVDGYDYVMRVNRMQSLGKAGKRIDGLYIATHRSYVNEFLTPELKARNALAKKIYVCMKFEPTFCLNWEKICTERQFRQHEHFAFKMHNYTNICPTAGMSRIPTQAYVLLDYLLTTPEWADTFDITFACSDIEGRDRLLRTGDPWKDNTHCTAGKDEAEYVRRQVRNGNLKLIECE